MHGHDLQNLDRRIFDRQIPYRKPVHPLLNKFQMEHEACEQNEDHQHHDDDDADDREHDRRRSILASRFRRVGSLAARHHWNHRASNAVAIILPVLILRPKSQEGRISSPCRILWRSEWPNMCFNAKNQVLHNLGSGINYIVWIYRRYASEYV